MRGLGGALVRCVAPSRYCSGQAGPWPPGTRYWEEQMQQPQQGIARVPYPSPPRGMTPAPGLLGGAFPHRPPPPELTPPSLGYAQFKVPPPPPQETSSDPSEAFSGLIDSFYRKGLLQEVDHVFRGIQAAQILVAVPTYRILIDIYSQIRDFEKMDMVYLEMKKAMMKAAGHQLPEQSPHQKLQASDYFVSLLDACYRRSLLHEVQHVYRALKSAQLTIPVPAYKILIETYSHLKNWAAMDAVYMEMKEAIRKSAATSGAAPGSSSWGAGMHPPAHPAHGEGLMGRPHFQGAQFQPPFHAPPFHPPGGHPHHFQVATPQGGPPGVPPPVAPPASAHQHPSPHSGPPLPPPPPPGAHHFQQPPPPPPGAHHFQQQPPLPPPGAHHFQQPPPPPPGAHHFHQPPPPFQPGHHFPPPPPGFQYQGPVPPHPQHPMAAAAAAGVAAGLQQHDSSTVAPNQEQHDGRVVPATVPAAEDSVEEEHEVHVEVTTTTIESGGEDNQAEEQHEEGEATASGEAADGEAASGGEEQEEAVGMHEGVDDMISSVGEDAVESMVTGDRQPLESTG